MTGRIGFFTLSARTSCNRLCFTPHTRVCVQTHSSQPSPFG